VAELGAIQQSEQNGSMANVPLGLRAARRKDCFAHASAGAAFLSESRHALPDKPPTGSELSVAPDELGVTALGRPLSAMSVEAGCDRARTGRSIAQRSREAKTRPGGKDSEAYNRTSTDSTHCRRCPSECFKLWSDRFDRFDSSNTRETSVH
jgi:hypothetical protein